MVRENVENCWNDEDLIEMNRLSGNSKFLKFGKSMSKILFLFCVYRNFFMESFLVRKSSIYELWNSDTFQISSFVKITHFHILE